MMQLPQGFTETAFDGLLLLYKESTLAPMLWEHLRMSEADARARIAPMEQAGLVKFTISPSREPSVFIAPRAAFMFFRDFEFASKLVDYFDTQGKFDLTLGKIVSAERDPATLVYRVFTPQGELSIASPVAKKLLEMALLTKDAEGRLHGPSRDQVWQWTEEHGVCDFCSSPNPQHVEIVPEFELVPAGIGDDLPTQSVGGWATCDTCHELVAENRRTDLLRRGVEASRGGKFTAAAHKGLHAKFWEAYDSKVDAAGVGAALIDFIENKINPEREFVNPKLQEKAARIDAIRKLTGLTHDEMDALGKGDVLYKEIAKKLSAWRKKFGADGYAGSRRVAEMLNASEQLAPHGMPHWQVALDMKVAALKEVQKIEKIDPNSRLGREIKWMDLNDDLTGLRMAEVYSFSAETMHAIITGSQSIPHESSLKSVEIPQVRSGWFWFAEPFPTTASPVSSDTTAAILWMWDTKTHKQPTLRFSAYVVDEKNADQRGNILPSTKWLWPVDLTFHEMLALNAQLYRNAYGPGGPQHGNPLLVGEEATLKVVADISLFFLMACLWFRQTVPGTKRKIDPVLTQSDGHIERHARKRAQKDLKLAEPPRVKVIALRRSEVEAVEHETVTDGTKRHLKVRFVVKGHPRLQRCGPGLKDQKLIWINPHPKGPKDAPFKESGPTVFAVVR